MTRLEEVQDAVASYMDEIKRQFKDGAKITVLVRQPDNQEQDFLMTDDDLIEVTKAIERRDSAAKATSQQKESV